jgi:ketosteroid isomerase-like protein
MRYPSLQKQRPSERILTALEINPIKFKLPGQHQLLMKEGKTMLRNGLIILCFALAVLFAGCANPPAPAPTVDTREADIQAVRNVESLYGNATDIDTALNYFAEDGAGFYPGAPIQVGKQSVRALLAPIFSDPNFSFSFQSLRTEASKGGDMAYSQGTYVMTTTDAKTKKARTENGKYLIIYRKQADGTWKVVADAAIPDTAM